MSYIGADGLDKHQRRSAIRQQYDWLIKAFQDRFGIDNIKIEDFDLGYKLGILYPVGQGKNYCIMVYLLNNGSE